MLCGQTNQNLKIILENMHVAFCGLRKRGTKCDKELLSSKNLFFFSLNIWHVFCVLLKMKYYIYILHRPNTFFLGIPFAYWRKTLGLLFYDSIVFTLKIKRTNQRAMNSWGCESLVWIIYYRGIFCCLTWTPPDVVPFSLSHTLSNLGHQLTGRNSSQPKCTCQMSSQEDFCLPSNLFISFPT